MVHIPVRDLWEFFCENRQTLAENFLLLADGEDGSLEIYLTEEDGLPYFEVSIDGEREYCNESISRQDAEGKYQEMLDIFGLTPTNDKEEENEILSNDDLDRIDEIEFATDEFLTIMMEKFPKEAGLDQNDIDVFISMVEEFLYETHGIQVRHPEVINIGDGCFKVSMYPFGDE